jgi:hypothetical protein
MEEITGSTVVQEESGITTEKFVYQSDIYYFKGYLTRYPNGKIISLRGNGFKFGEGEEKVRMGSILIYYVMNGHPSSNIVLEKSDDFKYMFELAQKITSVVK